MVAELELVELVALELLELELLALELLALELVELELLELEPVALELDDDDVVPDVELAEDDDFEPDDTGDEGDVWPGGWVGTGTGLIDADVGAGRTALGATGPGAAIATSEAAAEPAPVAARLTAY